MTQVVAGLLALVATAPAYFAGRLIAYVFQGARGGTFVAQLFWEFTAGGFAATGAFLILNWLIEDEVKKRATHLVVITIVLTLLALVVLLGLLSGYSYHGSKWEAAGGLLGLPLGFLVASLFFRADTR